MPSQTIMKNCVSLINITHFIKENVKTTTKFTIKSLQTNVAMDMHDWSHFNA